MQKKLRKIKQYSPRWNDNHDVPPGQFVTDKFPVLTFGKIPNIDKENLKIQVSRKNARVPRRSDILPTTSTLYR